MQSHLGVVALLVVLLILWKVFGKQFRAALIVRTAAGGGLNHIGQKAIAAQPEFISLVRDEFPHWANSAAVNNFKDPLVASGFEYVGTFKVDKMPGVQLAVLVKPDDHVSAHIYEHPKVGTWIELVTRYEDGACHTLTTLPATGVQSPPWVQTVRAANAPATELVRQFLDVRHAGDMKRVTADNAVDEFEQGYAQSILWQKNKGMSTEEMTQIVRNWATKRSAQGRVAGA